VSSGQNVRVKSSHRECAECEFVGVVDTFIDYETHTASWDCPACDTSQSENAEGKW